SKNVKREAKKVMKCERLVLQELMNKELTREQQNRLRNGSHVLIVNVT
ncbi:6718_t:CDS:1, partial [Funneliformis caledonium]